MQSKYYVDVGHAMANLDDCRSYLAVGLEFVCDLAANAAIVPPAHPAISCGQKPLCARGERERWQCVVVPTPFSPPRGDAEIGLL